MEIAPTFFGPTFFPNIFSFFPTPPSSPPAAAVGGASPGAPVGRGARGSTMEQSLWPPAMARSSRPPAMAAAVARGAAWRQRATRFGSGGGAWGRREGVVARISKCMGILGDLNVLSGLF
jgi:hypothetical protein